MTDSDPVGNKRKLRVKTRVQGGRAGAGIPGISRGKIAAALILAAAVGIFFGLFLGRGIKRMIRVRREQNAIAQSLSGSGSAVPEPAAAGSPAGPGESPGR